MKLQISVGLVHFVDLRQKMYIEIRRLFVNGVDNAVQKGHRIVRGFPDPVLLETHLERMIVAIKLEQLDKLSNARHKSWNWITDKGEYWHRDSRFDCFSLFGSDIVENRASSFFIFGFTNPKLQRILV